MQNSMNHGERGDGKQQEAPMTDNEKSNISVEFGKPSPQDEQHIWQGKLPPAKQQPNVDANAELGELITELQEVGKAFWSTNALRGRQINRIAQRLATLTQPSTAHCATCGMTVLASHASLEPFRSHDKFAVAVADVAYERGLAEGQKRSHASGEPIRQTFTAVEMQLQFDEGFREGQQAMAEKAAQHYSVYKENPDYPEKDSILKGWHECICGEAKANGTVEYKFIWADHMRSLAGAEPHVCPTGDHDDCTEMIVVEPAQDKLLHQLLIDALHIIDLHVSAQDKRGWANTLAKIRSVLEWPAKDETAREPGASEGA